MHFFGDNSKVLFKRACENSQTKPTCSKNQKLILTLLDNGECQKYICQDIQSSQGSGRLLGGIIGGTIGGVVVLLLAIAFLYYRFIYRKKRQLYDDEDDVIAMDEMEMDNDKTDYSISNLESFNGDPATAPLPPNVRMSMKEKPPGQNNSAKNSKLSFYDSFTRPTAKFSKAGRRGSRVPRTRVPVRPRVGVYLDSGSSRLSVATSTSTTNASNIIPIVYIPGVTVRPTKNNTRSIYSNETQSVFSDLNTIEQASIVGDVARANGDSTGSADATMTAIKAQPRLVNIDRIEEEDEDVTDEEYSDNDSGASNGAISHVSRNMYYVDDSSVRPTHQGDLINFTSQELNASHPNLIDTESKFDYDSDSDSDVDSDIGEINRATSIKRNAVASSSHANSGGSLVSSKTSQSHSTINYPHTVSPSHEVHDLDSPFRDQ